MPDHTIPVLKKAIAVLKAVAEGRGGMTTKALAHTLGVPSSTAYRILQTFVAEDWVRPLGGGQFELSFGLLPLLQPLVRHELLIETVREPLLKLSRETGLTTKITVRQGHFAVTIFRVESPRPTSLSVRVGATFHLCLGSSGAVLLSGLDEVERQRVIDEAPEECWQFQRPSDVDHRLAELATFGSCADTGKYRPNNFAVSAPLLDRGGQVLAALTIVGLPDDFEGARTEALRRQLMFAAGGCNQLIQGLPLKTAAGE